MSFSLSHKLTTLQFITATSAVIAVGVIAVRHKLDDVPVDLLAALIGIASLIIGLWQEVAKVRHIAEGVNVNRIMETLKLDDQLTNSPDHISVLEWLLRPPLTGMDAIRRGLILKQAAGHRNFFRIELDKPGEESSRVLALGEVIRKADHYVFAFTYGDPSYIIDFWEKPVTLPDYYDAHKEGIEKTRRGFKLQRVFVIPDQLHKNEHAFVVFVDALKRLRKLGMRDIFVVDESVAAAQIGGVPQRSFFVADDEFVSESEAKGIVATGYVAFSASEADRLNRQFSALRLAAGQPISDQKIKQLCKEHGI